MPVFNPKPTAPPAAVDSPPRAMAPENKNIIVDSRYTPLNAVTAMIEGTPMTVDYYSQVVDQDTGLSGQQLNRLAMNQQYSLVQQFVLRVTTPFNGDQEDSNSMTLQGSATVYPCLVPNVGDMFLADIGDGRLGVFQVTSSKRLSVMKGSAHDIDYQWVAYATEERLADFKKKTVKTTVFVLDQLMQEKTPFLAVEDFEARDKLRRLYHELVGMYFGSFHDNEYATLVVPEQDQITYDPFLTKAVLQLVETTDAPDIIKTRILNTDGDELMKAVSIWDVLLQRSTMQLQRTFTRAGTCMAQAFPRVSFLESVCHSGMQRVVYPIDPEGSVSARDLVRRKFIAEAIKRPPSENIADMLTTQALSGLDNVEGYKIQESIANAAETDYYVFSKAFYDNARKDQSRLENLVHDYLDNKQINPAEVLKIAIDYPGWERIDQFYFGPVLMLLIRHLVAR